MYSLLTLECAALLAEAVLYGIYVLTFSVTIIVLLRRRSSIADSLLATATIVMFVLSTAHLGLLGSSILRHIHDGVIGDGLEFRNPAYPEPILQIVLECLNCILGDAIISWRAWVLWNRSKPVLAVPATLLVAALACIIGLCRAVVVEPAGAVTFTSRNVQHWGAGALGLTFIANVWSVVLVALRFRTYQKEVAGNLPSKASSGGSPMVILLFLVETGTLYCCTLLLVGVTFISHTDGVYVMLDLLAQFTGLYPTLMVFLIAIRKAQRRGSRLTDGTAIVTQAADDTRTRQSTIVFAPVTTVNSVDSERTAGFEPVQKHRKLEDGLSLT